MVGGTVTSLLSNSHMYRLWQAPFARTKVRPFLERTDVSKAWRVLDVACGPGTNTAWFVGSFYLGIDLEHNYLKYAKRTYGRDYVVADLGAPIPVMAGSFDLILVNSVLHHLSRELAARLLANLADLLSDTGRIHVIDMVLPSRPGLARTLATLDRGRFARSLEHLGQLVEDRFDPLVVKTFEIAPLGLTLWQMVYFEGIRKV